MKGVLISHHRRVFGAECEDCDWRQMDSSRARSDARDHAADMVHETRLYEEETTIFRGRPWDDNQEGVDGQT